MITAMLLFGLNANVDAAVSKADHPPNWRGASSNQVKAIRANPEVFQRRNSASRLQHRNLA